jgi:hypothetical protein
MSYVNLGATVRFGVLKVKSIFYEMSRAEASRAATV